MLVLIIGWAFFYMLLPKGSVILAKFVKPVASQQVVDQEKNQLRISLREKMDNDVDQRQQSDPRLRNMGMRDFFRNLNNGGEAENKYIEDTDALQARFQSDLTEGLREIDQKYDNQRAVQAAIARNIARISPISCLTHFMVELSRTGTLANSQWQATHWRLRQILNEQITSKHKTKRFKNMSTSHYEGEREGPANR